MSKEKSLTPTHLKLFRSFYLAYPDKFSEIGHPLGDESDSKSIGHPVGDQSKSGVGFHPNLSWSHYRALMRVEKPSARQFYETEAVEGGWSKRQLERQIHSLFYERLLASKDKKGMLVEARNETVTEPKPMDVLKDPYVLEFLDLPDVDRLHESTLESAIISNLQHFLLELGKGFSFVARQKRMRFENEDFFIDLVLCSEKNEAIAKYSVLKESKQLFAAKYLTYLPSEEELQKELQRERSLIEESQKL